MKYKMEELLPLVKSLSEIYTGMSSTSVTYETAEQLMGAVIYCINENVRYVRQHGSTSSDITVNTSTLSAKDAYEQGFHLVMEKTKNAQNMYSQMIIGLEHYGNTAYYDAVIKGIPEFFKWYNPKLKPQDHIIMCDYPVLRSFVKLSGVDLMYEYIDCIRLEQAFLCKFPKEYVLTVLSNTYPDYSDLLINISEDILKNLLVNYLIEKERLTPQFTLRDREKIINVVSFMTDGSLYIKLVELLDYLIKRYFNDDENLSKYFKHCISNFRTELLNGVKNNCLEAILGGFLYE